MNPTIERLREPLNDLFAMRSKAASLGLAPNKCGIKIQLGWEGIDPFELKALLDALETSEARLAKAVDALNSAKYHMHNGNLGSCESAIMRCLAEIAAPEPTTGGIA